MKKLLLLSLVLLGLGGKMWAGKLYATLSTEWYINASWNAGTNTMYWNGVWAAPSGGWGSYYFLNTGLPSGDITSYTKFHATLSNFSDNVDHVWLRIKQGDDNYADAKLVAGENNIDLVALAAANPAVDFTKVTDITIWGANEAVSGKSIDGENPASVVIQNVYLQSVKNVVKCSGLSNEITSLSDVSDGSLKFVISDASASNVLYFFDNQDAKSAALAQVPFNSYFYYTLTKINGLDLDGDTNDDDDIYAINIVNGDGTAFPAPYNLGNNVNFTNWGSIFSGSAQADKAKGYGTDAQYQGIWKVAYTDGEGFSFKNCSLNKYLKVNGSQDAVCYLRLYEGLGFEVNTEFDKENNPANADIFSLASASGYDAETGLMTNGTWTFTDPVDVSNWDYLYITMAVSGSDGDHKIIITDDNGVSVAGDEYDGQVAHTGQSMWLSRWNFQNIACISLDYLRIEKGLDLSKIKTLQIQNSVTPSVIYLSDFAHAKLVGSIGRYDLYKHGDVERSYNSTGKFGTICLPFVASCAGAEVYNIVGHSTKSISLEKVTGLLEAGKPYLYMSTDENGADNGKSVLNVNFFRADLDTYDVTVPVPNNGLIGTFTDTTAPQGDNYYVLSNNKLYQVNSNVTVGANKAYIDVDQITNSSSTKARVNLFFDGADETTGIENLDAIETLTSGKVYDLSGRVVTAPTKGLYIVNGKKVFVK